MNKIDKLMDYLYDEMTPHDRAAFEEELAMDGSLKQALAELQEGKLLADQLDAPPLPLIAPPLTTVANHHHHRLWLPMLGIAATFLIGLLCWIGVEVRIEDDGVLVAFGTTTASPQPIVEQPQMRMESSKAPIVTIDSLLRQRLQAQQQTNEQVLAAFQQKQQQQWNQLVKSLKQETLPQMVEAFQVMQLEQQTTFQEAIKTMWDQTQQQRIEDLTSINAAFTDLYQSVDYRQQATENLLQDLLVTSSDY